MNENWVRQKVASTGTGPILLGDAVDTYLTISQQYNDGGWVNYVIEDEGNRETGIGTYVSTSNTLQRSQIIETIESDVFNKNNPTPIAVSSNAIIGVAPTAHGNTFHEPVWKQLVGEFIHNPNTSLAYPEMKEWVLGVQGMHFDPQVAESINLRFVVNNDIKEGTKMRAVVRWSPRSADVGTVRWALATSQGARDGGIFQDAAVIYLEQDGGGTENAHRYVESAIEFGAPPPDTIIVGRLFRDSAHANDTFPADAVLHAVSFSYQCDKVGTAKRDPDYNDWSN